MSLKPCRTCGEEISITAIKCPNCGEPYKRGIDVAQQQFMKLVVVCVLIWAFINWIK